VALLCLVGVAPVGAAASVVRVEPYSEPPEIGDGSCARYSTCPVDMVAVTAASGETNALVVSETLVSYTPSRTRSRFVVRDYVSPVVAGPGCEPVADEPPYASAVVCAAETVGPLELGDGNDRIDAPHGWASGGSGDDTLVVRDGRADGGAGDDVLVTGGTLLASRGGAGDDLVIADRGEGGGGDDWLIGSGLGGPGDDVLRCPPQSQGCFLDGGTGNDSLRGGTRRDRLLGGRGDDRVVGGAGQDVLAGGAGADRLGSREDRSAGEKPRKDTVDCGGGRRDHAIADRRDEVLRCERLTLPRQGR
jgi:hypothetical protein